MNKLDKPYHGSTQNPNWYRTPRSSREAFRRDVQLFVDEEPEAPFYLKAILVGMVLIIGFSIVRTFL